MNGDIGLYNNRMVCPESCRLLAGESPVAVMVRHLLSAKAQRRQALAALSWEEKVAIIEQMRVLLPKGQWKHRAAEEGLAGNGHADQHKLLPDAPIEMEERNQ